MANPSLSRRDYDAAVIGGGIVGLCLGRHLAQSGMSVTVLDRGEPGAAASGANAGTLALQNKRPPLLTFYKEAVAEWHRLAAAIGLAAIGYKRPGGYHVATSAEEVASLRSVAAAQERAGTLLEWLEGPPLRARAPWLGEGVRAATHATADAYANPLLVGPALLEAARSAGAEVVGQAAVQRVVKRPRGFELRTSSGAVGCRIAVIAAGAWSHGVGTLFEANLPVRSSVIVLSVSEPTAPALDAILTHVGGRLTVKQVSNGTCLIGGGWPGRGSLESNELRIDPVMLRHNLGFAATVVPSLARLRLVRSWAGFETATPDSLPIAGALDRRTGVFAAIPAAGGFTAGPLLARAVAEAILTGTMPEMCRSLDPARFGTGAISRT